jgi:single-strand DNA-binding protein
MSYSDTNRVILLGRLTRDPELRALPSGRSVCSLRLACNGIRKDGDSYQERPLFFDVSVFGAQGENVDRYLRKGSRVAIDGRLDWREWETSDQQKRQSVSVISESVQFLDTPVGAQRHAGDIPGEDGAGEDHEAAAAGPDGGQDIVF